MRVIRRLVLGAGLNARGTRVTRRRGGVTMGAEHTRRGIVLGLSLLVLGAGTLAVARTQVTTSDRKSTRLNSSHRL